MNIRVFGLVLAGIAVCSTACAGPLRPGELLTANLGRNQLVAIDPATGEERIFSGDGVVGEGPSFTRPRSVFIGSDRRVFVQGRGDNPIIEVDPETGDRRAVVGLAAGHGEDCCRYQGIVSLGDGTLVTVDVEADRLRRITASTGESYAFGPHLGRGHSPSQLLLNDEGDFILSSDNPDQIRIIDSEATQYRYHNGSPPSLIRVLAESGYYAPALTLRSPNSMALDASGTLYSASTGDALEGILRIDSVTGQRERVTGSNRLGALGYENPYERGDGPGPALIKSFAGQGLRRGSRSSTRRYVACS